MYKPTICLFGTYFYNYSRNSILRDGLRDNGIRVIEAHQDLLPIRLESAEDFSLINMVKRIWRTVVVYFKLAQEYKKVKMSDYVVVLYPGHGITPLAWILCRVFNKKLIFDSFTSLYDSIIIDRGLSKERSFKATALKHVENIILKLPDKLFTDTQLIKKFISDTFKINGSNIFVIPLGANNHIYLPLLNTKKEKEIKVLFFGGYNPILGVPYILKAAKILKIHENIEFIMIGDGALKKDAEQFVQDNKLENILFIDRVVESELVEHIQNSDIMLGLFSNNRMGLRIIPNKIFAGIACKKPLITANSPAVEEFFTHQKNILFVQPENPPDLAEKILFLAKNENIRRGIAESAYSLYKEKFTPKIIAKSFLQQI